MADTVDFQKLLEQRAQRELFENVEYTDALICLYYPQYRLEDLHDMSEGDANQLLRVAQAVEISRNMQHLTNLAAATSKAGFTKVMASYSKTLKELRR